MRDYKQELENRITFIKNMVKKAHADGIVYGNSGGKDSALVGILCKKACENTVGIIMPCMSKQNYNSDKDDGILVSKQFNIETRIVDLTKVKQALLEETEKITTVSTLASANISPRLRMTALYTVAGSENRIVAGTGNKSEGYMGYFTKWGDGAYDFNPIADLTVTEIYEFLEYLNAPESIIKKAPSAGLFEGQTDEKEMGISYTTIDKYINGEAVNENDKKIIEKYHNASEHKRNMPETYK